MTERLCAVLGVPVRFEPAREPYLVNGQSAAIVVDVPGDASNGRSVVGVVGAVVPAIADARGLPAKDRVMVAELNLDLLMQTRAVSSDATRPLPRHPFVVRDLSIIVSDGLPAADIFGTIQAAGRGVPAPLVAVSFFDRYQGKGVPEGSVSVSVRLTFQAADRTLTDAEVQQSFDTILAALGREHGAVQR